MKTPFLISTLISLFLLAACTANGTGRSAETAPAAETPPVRVISSQYRAESRQFQGTIRAYDVADYDFYAEKGDNLYIALHAEKPLYFNVTAPNTDEALFNGSAEGSEFKGTAEVGGTYRIRVYQMRAAARRGTKTPYRLEWLRSRTR